MRLSTIDRYACYAVVLLLALLIKEDNDMMFMIIMASAPAAIILSSLALYIAIKSMIEIKALKNSTHSMQFVPLTPDSTDTGLSDTELSKRFEVAGPTIKEERETALQETLEDL